MCSSKKVFVQNLKKSTENDFDIAKECLILNWLLLLYSIYNTI